MGIETVGALLVKVIVGTLAAVTVGAITQKLTQKKAPKPEPSKREARLLVRSATSPRRVIYGTSGRISGYLAYATVTGSQKNVLHLIVAVAGHECEAVDEYFLNDERVGEMDADGNVTAGKFAGKARFVAHLGTDSQTPHADLVSEVADWTDDHAGKGVCWIWVRLNFAGAENVFTAGIPTPRFVIRGKKDILDTRTSTTSWTNNAALCCFDMIRGDHAFAASSTELDYAYIDAQANISDEWAPGQIEWQIVSIVAVGSTGVNVWVSAPNFSTHSLRAKTSTREGSYVQLASITGSSPDINGVWEVIWADASAMFQLSATVSTVGTPGDAQHVTRRYTCDGNYLRDEKLRSVLEGMLTSCAGTAAPHKGKWRVHVGAAGTVTRADFTESDITGAFSLQPKPGRDSLFNSVRGTFVDPDRSWTEKEFPEVTNATYVTQDNEKKLWRDVSFPFTICRFTAQRLARIELDKSRTSFSFQVPVKKSALDVAYWDVVSWNLPFIGISSEEFRVLDWSIQPDGRIALSLQSDSAFSYDDIPSTIFPGFASVVVSTPDVGSVAPPTGVFAESGGDDHLIIGTDGSVLSLAHLHWTSSLDAYVVRYEGEHKRSSESLYTAGALATDEETTMVFGPLEDLESYDFRMRAVNQLSAKSVWVSVLNHVVIGKTERPADVSVMVASARVDGFIDFSWEEVPDVDVRSGGGGDEIRYQTGGSITWESGTPIHTDRLHDSPQLIEFKLVEGAVSFGIKAVDSSGNYSLNQFEDANVSVVHPQNVDAPSGVTAVSGNTTYLIKQDGTVVPRVRLTWNDPDHPSAEGIGIQQKRDSEGTWSQVAVVELGEQRIYLSDVVEGEDYSFRVRSRAARGYFSSYETVLAHTVAGKTAPPSDPTSLSVNTLSGGIREYRWTMPSPLDRDIAGYLLRYKSGSGHAWAALDGQLGDEGTGLIPASPYESTLLSAGAYSFGVAAQDTSGNVSANPVVVDATLGEPPIEGALVQEDFLRTGWPGVKASCTVDGDMKLVADASASNQWQNMTTWDTRDSWKWASVKDWEYRHETAGASALVDIGFEATFTPLLGLTAVNANVSTAFNYRSSGGAYSGWVNDPGPITAQYIRVRAGAITVDATKAAYISQALFICAADAVEETLADVSTIDHLTSSRAGDFRVPINETYNLITGVQLAFQNTGPGWTWEIIDKDPSLGPRLRVYNSAGADANAVVDINVKGL